MQFQEFNQDNKVQEFMMHREESEVTSHFVWTGLAYISNEYVNPWLFDCTSKCLYAFIP